MSLKQYRYKSSSGRSAAERRRGLIEAYVEWLRPMQWDWFTTLTFPGYPRRKMAEYKFRKWVEQLRDERGRTDFRFVRITEYGAFEDNLHFHLVIGGLKRGTKTENWRKHWQVIAGRALILPYDEQQNGVGYLLKTLRPDEDFDIVIEGVGASHE